MKKFIAILTCLILLSAILPLSLSAAGVAIDAVKFPDPVFRSYVQQFDLDKNESLSEKECAVVTSVLISEISNDAVASLAGIKNFKNLEWVNCSGSNLSELDLSGMSRLKTVCVSQNNLKTINLSDCPALNMLNCQFNQLTKINLTGCSSLKTIFCNNNQLAELDISDCALLETLIINENHIATIDITENKKLVYFLAIPQDIMVQKVQKNGKWTVDIGKLMGKSNLGKVTVDSGVLNTSTGILTFDTEPVQFNYTYKASVKFRIDGIALLYQGGLPVITANNLSFDPRDIAFDSLKEPGLDLNAFDSEDGNLTASVKAQVKTITALDGEVSNITAAYETIPMVDTKKPGLYIIVYTVSDSIGNTASLDVYITVRMDGSTGSDPASILLNQNIASGSSVSSSEKSISSTSVLSVESGVSPPPLGGQNSGMTIILAAMLASAAVIVLLAKRRQKAD